MRWWHSFKLAYYDIYTIILLIVMVVSWVIYGTWEDIVKIVLSDFSLTGLFVIGVFLAILYVYHLTKRLYKEVKHYFQNFKK